MKVFDENGEKLLLAKRVKAYLDLSGLINKTLTIRRLVIKEPLIQADEEQAKAIEKSIQEYLAKTREDAFKVKVIAVEVQEGSGAFRSDGLKTAFSVNGMRGEVIIGNVQRITINVKTLTVAREGIPEISGGVSAPLSFKGDTLTIQRAAGGSMGCPGNGGIATPSMAGRGRREGSVPREMRSAGGPERAGPGVV